MDLFTTDWGKCFEDGVVDVNTPPRLSCVFIVIQNVINAALVLSAVVAVFLITYAAFQYVTSAGDKEKVDSARKRIVFAVIGLVIIFSAFAAINFISTFTGVSPSQLGVGK